jgi:signal transduction histidine kinase
LAIVHGIVTSHRGAITVASTQGVGTRFAFYPELPTSTLDFRF